MLCHWTAAVCGRTRSGRVPPQSSSTPGRVQSLAGHGRMSAHACGWPRSDHGLPLPDLLSLRSGFRCHCAGCRCLSGVSPSLMWNAGVHQLTGGQLGTPVFLESLFLWCPWKSLHVFGRTRFSDESRTAGTCPQTVGVQFGGRWLCLSGLPDHGRNHYQCGSLSGLAWILSVQRHHGGLGGPLWCWIRRLRGCWPGPL